MSGPRPEMAGRSVPAACLKTQFWERFLEGGKMQVTWLDVVKLTIPFVTAISMVWIKAWVEEHLARKGKQQALARGISDELHSFNAPFHPLKTIAQSPPPLHLPLAP